MKRVMFCLALLGLILQSRSAGVADTPPSSDPAIALVSKVILDVFRKEVDADWQKARRGQVLVSGERVKTEDRSFAIIKFKDNSLVRVREKTELTVTGGMSGNAFSKSVNVERGVIGFNVKKQQADEEFRFTSPTSVASIRGTGGQFSSSDSVDLLIVVEGLVSLSNSVSSKELDVPTGFTGVSRPDGTLESRPSTAEERLAAESAARATDQDNRLEFDLRDGRGGLKKLKIDFNEQ